MTARPASDRSQMEHRIRAALAMGDRRIFKIGADLGVGSGIVKCVKAAL